VSGVAPWIPVEPSTNPQAILGPLPFTQGSVSYTIPSDVVPDNATGILVFAWTALTGVNPGKAWWHFAVNVGDGTQNWFSMLVAGDPSGVTVTSSSQVFWLPFPSDRQLEVTLFANDLPSGMNDGGVEIHGFLPWTP
jgi:hypothetical protein